MAPLKDATGTLKDAMAAVKSLRAPLKDAVAA
jgi:hypothetical protein